MRPACENGPRPLCGRSARARLLTMSNRYQTSIFGGGFAALVCFVAATLGACGIITDKDRIRVARWNNQYFTRGDLQEAIRDMPNEERPQIRTKGDLRAVLSDIIDERLKQAQAEALKNEGKINVSRDEAEARYALRNPEKYMEYLQLSQVLPEEDLAMYEEDRQLGIDREQERLYGQRALAYLINDAVQNGTLVVSEEQYEKQYNLRKDQLLTAEQVAIEGVYLPIDAHEDAAAEASNVLEELEQGGDPKAIAERYGPEKAGYLEVGLTNDTPHIKFGSFWQQASQSEEGDVISCYISEWNRNVKVAGETKTEPIPDSLLVCRITRYVPQRQKTLEEAKPDLSASILYSEMMERLRDAAGVEIYDDKLPDPGMYDSARPSSIFQQ